MKKKSTSQSAPARRPVLHPDAIGTTEGGSLGEAGLPAVPSSAVALLRRVEASREGGFLNLRVLFGLFVMLAGVFLALVSLGTFSSVSAETNRTESTHAQIQPIGVVPGESAAVRPSGATLVGRPEPAYGTAELTSHTLQALGFESPGSTGLTVTGSRFCSAGICFFDAPLLLPAGAAIQRIELEACDSSATAAVEAQLFRITGPDASFSLLAQVSTGAAATPGCNYFSVDLAPVETVDNRNFTYFVQILIGGAGSATRFQAVRVYYRLQVSPPPGTATFNDVPTSSPWFPYVEALTSAGVTGGCAPNLYCPNDPITRGQMAVFLAKALGLQWAP
jgi:S-layer homology domain